MAWVNFITGTAVGGCDNGHFEPLDALSLRTGVRGSIINILSLGRAGVRVRVPDGEHGVAERPAGRRGGRLLHHRPPWSQPDPTHTVHFEGFVALKFAPFLAGQMEYSPRFWQGKCSTHPVSDRENRARTPLLTGQMALASPRFPQLPPFGVVAG